MTEQNPIEYTGKVLDQRNDLTGPTKGKGTYPERPKHVSIKQNDGNRGEETLK